MTIAAYPLAWPDGWKRTQAARRRPGHFHKRERPGGDPARMAEINVAQEAGLQERFT